MSSPNPPETIATAPATAAPAGKTPRSAKTYVFLVLSLGLLTIGFFYGLDYALASFTHESTDDAFLESHIITVAPRVAGQVLAVHIKENQRVKAGDPLLEIDPRDFETRLTQRRAVHASADANLASAEAGVALVKARFQTAEATERQEQANVEAARAKAQRAEANFKRAEKLRETKVTSPEEFDQAKADADSTAADLRAAEQKAAAANSQVLESRAQIGVAQTILEGMSTKIKQADADQAQADLELSYTRIVAPCDGQIVRKSVEPGNYVQVGQSLMAVVTPRLWVVANFKESQLQNLRAGQPAEIRLDAYPHQWFKGHVDSFQAGSGSRFSLLPPENAVGNYVKIVQRVPVKLYFDEPIDPAYALGPGMSVVPRVRTSDFNLAPAVLWIAAVLLAAVSTAGLVRVVNHLRE